VIARGLHSTVGREEYDALPHLNYSLAKEIQKSPKHFRFRKSFARTDSPTLKLGRVCHLAIFEPDVFRSNVAKWEGDRRAGKEWEKFKADHAGKELVTAAEHAEACAMREAVMAHKEARALVEDGQPEVTGIGKLLGLDVKARFDRVGQFLVELKTTRHAAPAAFQNDCARLLYHGQFAWYSDVLSAAAEERPMRVITLENEPPYCVAVFRVEEDVLSAGRVLYEGWLRTYLRCMETGEWPGPTEEVLPLRLPAWAPGCEDEEAINADAA
jgi:hypothetical protein